MFELLEWGYFRGLWLLVDASVYCFPVGLELSPNFDFVESEVGFVALFDGFLCLLFDSFVVV